MSFRYPEENEPQELARMSRVRFLFRNRYEVGLVVEVGPVNSTVEMASGATVSVTTTDLIVLRPWDPI